MEGLLTPVLSVPAPNAVDRPGACAFAQGHTRDHDHWRSGRGQSPMFLAQTDALDRENVEDRSLLVFGFQPWHTGG